MRGFEMADCKGCNNTGKCPRCKGTGKEISMGGLSSNKCPKCGGSGNCTVCDGKGRV